MLLLLLVVRATQMRNVCVSALVNEDIHQERWTNTILNAQYAVDVFCSSLFAMFTTRALTHTTCVYTSPVNQSTDHHRNILSLKTTVWLLSGKLLSVFGIMFMLNISLFLSVNVPTHARVCLCWLLLHENFRVHSTHIRIPITCAIMYTQRHKLRKLPKFVVFVTFSTKHSSQPCSIHRRLRVSDEF